MKLKFQTFIYLQLKLKKGNIEARSCNHCYRRKPIYIIYSERAFVAVVIRHAMCMRHIFICYVCGSTIFFYIIS